VTVSNRPKLVSFKLCPFVQKAIITFKVKSVAFDFEYIDLADPPEWFTLVSPLNRVPILFAENQVLFESAAICEYIDECWPIKLMPESPLDRARHRAWVAFADNCLWDLLYMSRNTSRDDYQGTVDRLFFKLDQVESELDEHFWFHGDEFTLVDGAFATLFFRLELLNKLTPGLFNASRHPKLQRWKYNLLELPAVSQSAVPDFAKLYYQMIGRRQGYLAGLLPAAYRATGEVSAY